MIFGKKKHKDIPENIKKPEPTFNIISSLPAQDREDRLTAEDIGRIIEKWLAEEFVKFKTRLTKRQVWAITKLQTIADRYDIGCIQRVLHEFRIAKLSEGGESSKELVSILRERLSTLIEEKGSGSNLGRFFD